MCVLWTVVGLASLGLSVTTWAAFRILVLSRSFDSPDIIEDVPHDRRMHGGD